MSSPHRLAHVARTDWVKKTAPHLAVLHPPHSHLSRTLASSGRGGALPAGGVEAEDVRSAGESGDLCSGMDVLDEVPVRFHFGGHFLNDGKKMHYYGGTTAMSYIDRDKISLPEVVGHLRDHCSVSEGSLLHWLSLKTREPHEKPKATKMSRVGTVITCHKCKGVGHNRSSCDKRSANASATAPSTGGASAHTPGPIPASAPGPITTSGNQQSSTNKRKLSMTTENSIGTTTSTKQAKTLGLVNSRARARVTTSPSGSATIQMHARAPNSTTTSSVTINVRSGSASATCSIQEPQKKKQVQKKTTAPMLLLPPWDSAKL